jgi:hypothetical protein
MKQRLLNILKSTRFWSLIMLIVWMVLWCTPLSFLTIFFIGWCFCIVFLCIVFRNIGGCDYDGDDGNNYESYNPVNLDETRIPEIIQMKHDNEDDDSEDHIDWDAMNRAIF